MFFHLFCLLVFVSCLCLVCCKKVMLGYLPHCADIGCEPTSVALMYKEEPMLRLGFVHLNLVPNACFCSLCI